MQSSLSNEHWSVFIMRAKSQNHRYFYVPNVPSLMRTDKISWKWTAHGRNMKFSANWQWSSIVSCSIILYHIASYVIISHWIVLHRITLYQIWCIILNCIVDFTSHVVGQIRLFRIALHQIPLYLIEYVQWMVSMMQCQLNFCGYGVYFWGWMDRIAMFNVKELFV